MPDCAVSIIVPCRNEAGSIEAFLRSLLDQQIDCAWEALIADGASDDGTRQILDRYARMHSRIRVIHNGGRYTAMGLNQAIRLAQGEICVRMDVHTEYAPDYVQRSIECLKRTGCENVGGPARTRAASPLQRTVAAAFHSFFSTGGALFHDVDYEGYVDTVPYGCWWRSKLLEIGLFDESLVRNEDDELNLRLTLAGGRIYQCPAILSWYYPRSTINGLVRQYFQYGFWKVFVFHKHRRLPSWRHVIPALFLLVNVALLTALALTAVGFGLPDALTPLLAIDGIYLACSFGASLLVASSAGGMSLLYAPFVFLAFHLGYGLGFLVGCVYVLQASGRAASHEAFTSLTR